MRRYLSFFVKIVISMRAVATSLFPLVLAAQVMGCAEEEVPTEEFYQTYVVSRISVDPVTEFGYGLTQNNESFAALFDFLADVSCDGRTPFIFELTGTRQGQRAWGNIGLDLGLYVRGGHCDGSAELISTGLFDTEDGGTSVRGPFYIEGQIADGRVDVRPLNDITANLFQGWVQVIAELHRGTWEVNRGSMTATWTVPFLHSNVLIGFEPRTWLDYVVVNGLQPEPTESMESLQPDVDVDGDGLERFYDTDFDGLIDECVDGDGTTWSDDLDCPNRVGFTDGFELNLVFRVVPCTII